MLKIYTTTTCAYCAAVKKFLDLKGEEYEAINIDDNPEMAAEASLLTNGLMSVPITTNGKEFVVGFQPSKILGLL